MALIHLQKLLFYELAITLQSPGCCVFPRASFNQSSPSREVNGFWLRADIIFPHGIEKAVVDTGAPVSVFPKRIWEHAQVDPININGVNDLRAIRGINGISPCDFGFVTCKFLDSQNGVFITSQVPAKLCQDNSVKVALLGFMGFLENAKINIAVQQNVACLEVVPP